MRESAGRPRKSNAEHELSGSKNGRVEQIESDELKNPDIPPPFLTDEAQRQWLHFVPNGKWGEMDRMILCILSTLLAKFYNEKVYGDESPQIIRGQPVVSEESRERITKQIMDISDKLGMNPLSRQRSGISLKKTGGIKTRPN